MALLGEGALIFEHQPVTVYTATLVGGIAGVYSYVYGFRRKEK